MPRLSEPWTDQTDALSHSIRGRKKVNIFCKNPRLIDPKRLPSVTRSGNINHSTTADDQNNKTIRNWYLPVSACSSVCGYNQLRLVALQSAPHTRTYSFIVTMRPLKIKARKLCYLSYLSYAHEDACTCAPPHTRVRTPNKNIETTY